MDFTPIRIKLGMSQSRLARLSGVSRFKICTAELGSTKLSSDDLNQIDGALQAELRRLRNMAEDSLGSYRGRVVSSLGA